MEWIKIEENNLPKGNVLCTNFDIDNPLYKEKIYGTVSFNYGIIWCKTNIGRLDVTHYIDIDKFDL